ncbi:MAG: type II secretion system major pseudopilin GspG [Phycisphaerales bacterium]|nr:type II secretion system major pseudopilin GspG [Phycisphaerales bacterium]
MIRRSSQGFTLIELLLVLIILAVLAGIATPMYLNQSGKAKTQATTAGISNIKTALNSFYMEFDRFPTTDEGLEALINPPLTRNGEELGSYLDMDVAPRDGWDQPFMYICPGVKNPKSYDLWSIGANGIDENGEGDDITSWTKNR